ncbi:hypothetical protein N7488_008161 [Penicillium malachiteum]|nr:hypothetical protein N7488_008161 [Penicillium malachiteum]
MPQYPSEQFKPGQTTPAARPQRPNRPSLKGHPDIRSTKEYKAAARKPNLDTALLFCIDAMVLQQAMLWPAFRRPLRS